MPFDVMVVKVTIEGGVGGRAVLLRRGETVCIFVRSANFVYRASGNVIAHAKRCLVSKCRCEIFMYKVLFVSWRSPCRKARKLRT